MSDPNLKFSDLNLPELAVAAIEEAFTQELISRFHQLSLNAVTQGTNKAVAEFTQGLAELGKVRVRAIAAVQKAFG